MSPTKAVVFLHGSGDSGEGVREAVSFYAPDFIPSLEAAGAAVLFPTAPERKYGPAGGALMRVWFSRAALAYDAAEDTAHVADSCKLVDAALSAAGVRPEDAVVGGFSMGGGLALHYAYGQRGAPVAGVFASGSFAAQGGPVGAGPLGSAPPLLQRHGEADSLIDCGWGAQTAARLEEAGVTVDWATLPGVDHTLTGEVLQDVLAFCKQRLQPAG
eukprot:TRINITY_DN35123_c0_g1_i1.p1 TRINITY_DN35123_c0_g1~~TRINITY_DN35123_c0_g1_i1.p1  ORF type:complete len:241 (+),score=66.93 TRINITY_DN35123_c0_g1_i1:81-725(+)